MKKIMLIVALAAVSASACITMNAQLPGTLRGDMHGDDYRVVGKYEDTVEHTYYLWGLSNKPKADIFAPAMQKEVARVGGDGLANIEYSSEIGCLQMAIGGCTCGIIAPWTYHIKGDIVVIQKPALPGDSLLQKTGSAKSSVTTSTDDNSPVTDSGATTTPAAARPAAVMNY